MVRCQTWSHKAKQCRNEATGFLFGPGGLIDPVPGGQICSECSESILAEYKEKMGEEWFVAKIDQWGRPLDMNSKVIDVAKILQMKRENHNAPS